ncbi:MAG: hypothetical protein IPJ88_07815 [Myxococcales bacterium]|nr:MAG: hypothetical protein IPJ88_07815 [Myxococcales bacterium]
MRAGLRPGFGVGGDALKIWGTGDEKGPDRPQGYWFELEARSEADYVLRGLHFGLRLSYFMFQTKFSGQPTCEDPSPPCGFGEPWLPWPVNATTGAVGGLLEPVNDHYFRASLMVGYTWPPGP